MAKAKEEWDQDIIRRRRALEDGKVLQEKFKAEKSRAHELRILHGIEYGLDDEAYGIKEKMDLQVKKRGGSCI